MKRIIIALVLLAVTIVLNFLSEMRVRKYCTDVKKELRSAISLIEEKDYKAAKKKVENTKKDKTLVAYIYNLDFKKIKKELDDAENLIDIKEDEYAKICIMRSISLAEDIYEEYSFFGQIKNK